MAFCSTSGIAPAQFESRVFWRCLHPHAWPLAALDLAVAWFHRVWEDHRCGARKKTRRARGDCSARLRPPPGLARWSSFFHRDFLLIQTLACTNTPEEFERAIDAFSQANGPGERLLRGTLRLCLSNARLRRMGSAVGFVPASPPTQAIKMTARMPLSNPVNSSAGA